MVSQQVGRHVDEFGQFGEGAVAVSQLIDDSQTSLVPKCCVASSAGCQVHYSEYIESNRVEQVEGFWEASGTGPLTDLSAWLIMSVAVQFHR